MYFVLNADFPPIVHIAGPFRHTQNLNIKCLLEYKSNTGKQ